MNELERRLDEVVWLLRDQRHVQPKGQSLPRREFRRVDAEDRWGGSRRERSDTLLSSLQRESQLPISASREAVLPSLNGFLHHHSRSSWGTWLPNSSRESPHSRRRDQDKKMELPVFAGDNAWGWLVKIERYFLVNGIDGDKRMEVVLLAMEGRALNWFQNWEEIAFPSWRQFRGAVVRRFQPSTVKNSYGPLLSEKSGLFHGLY